jgi:hypothetical protein
MKGIDTRLLRAFLFVVFLVVVTNFNYIFDKKKEPEPEPSPGPAPGPAPEPTPEAGPTPEPAPELPAKEESSMKTVEAVKTNLFAEVQTVERVPKAMVKTEGYISYTDI